MYTKPSLAVVDLSIEHNSCKCGPSKIPTAVGQKLNPANASCGAAFMTTSTSQYMA